MKLTILTTNTIHHCYFVQEALKSDLEVSVISENPTPIKNIALLEQSFETSKKAYETKRNNYESQKWFQGRKTHINSFPNVYEVNDINSKSTINKLIEINPDLLVVFGTGLVRKGMISIFENKIFNLHGGDPEKYRGLDSHYWSIYHKDFKSLITTLHKVRPILDTGEIVLQGRVKLWSNMELYQLRASNTELCVDLMFSLVDLFKSNKPIIGRIQKSKGRYYSLMPEALKHDVKIKFDNYIKKNSKND